MKRFSSRIAAKALAVIIAVDVLLLFLNQALPDTGPVNWVLGIPWWLINFPGFPFVRFLDGPGFAVAFIAVPLSSALLWSIVAGYAFHKRHVS